MDGWMYEWVGKKEEKMGGWKNEWHGWSRPVVQARDVKAWAVKELKSWAGVLNIHLEKDSAGRGKGFGMGGRRRRSRR